MNKLIGIVAATSLLSACGLSDKLDFSLNKADIGKVALLLKDQSPTNYQEAWIRLKKVEGQTQTGDKKVFYTNDTGTPINVVSKTGVANLLNTVQVPNATYDQFLVTIDANIKLVEKSGTTWNYRIPSSTNDIVVKVAGNPLAIRDNVKSLILDVDTNSLADPKTNPTPTIRIIDDKQSSITRTVANLDGEIESVESDQRFRFRPSSGDLSIDVKLHPSAVVNELTRQQVGTDLRNVTANEHVRVYGNFDLQTMRIEAVSIEASENHRYSTSSDKLRDQSGNELLEVRGTIVSTDGNEAVIDVSSADFVPSGNTVTILNLANAQYVRGSADVLAPGQTVEIKTTNAVNTLMAQYVEIEGARSNGTVTGNQVAEYKGVIQSTQTNQFILASPSSTATEITVSLAPDVWFKHGNASCVTNGARVEVTGTTGADGTLTANVVEIEGSCATTLTDDEKSENTSSQKESEENTTESSERENELKTEFHS